MTPQSLLCTKSPLMVQQRSRRSSPIRLHQLRISPLGVDNQRHPKIKQRQGNYDHFVIGITVTSLLLCRSSSQAQARRNNIRQPSPPILSQVEGTASSLTQSRNNNPASNSFDPFVISSDSDSDNRSRTNMSSTAKNSSSTPPPQGGKAAARRRRPQITTPTPATRTVPVPRSNVPSNRPSISRSAPSQSPAPLRAARRASAICAADFPVCDDTTDVDDDTSSSPSTPTREKSATWQQLVSEQGPRTAPLKATAGFPFAGNSNYNTPSPTRRHYRTPSEGVFNMSFDEDMTSTSDTFEEQKLFGLMPRKHGSLGPSVTRAGKDKAGFFASSVFQNSPSPDELPPPPF